MPSPTTIASDLEFEHRFRATLGHYASGLTVIAAHTPDGPVGFTCQSFHSTSVEPPLISFGVMNSSRTYPLIRAGGAFVVNVLSHDQQDTSRLFGSRVEDRGRDTEWDLAPSGHPILRDSLAWVDCTLEAEYEAGDHVIVLGRVHALGMSDRPEARPLIFYKGAYHQL